MNYHINSMLETVIDTSVKTNKQEEKITDLSPKLSTYEDLIDSPYHKYLNRNS